MIFEAFDYSVLPCFYISGDYQIADYQLLIEFLTIMHCIRIHRLADMMAFL